MSKQNQEKVTEPDIEVATSHIRPITQDKWKARAPSDSEKRIIATTVMSLDGHKKRYEFSFGYHAYYMTIKNANNTKYMQKWLNPTNPEEALEDARDIREKASLVGHQGYDVYDTHEVNLMVGDPDLVHEYIDMLKQGKKDIRFLVITDEEKYPASSITQAGDQLANIDMVGMIREEEMKEIAAIDNKSLSEFNNE